VTLKGTHTLMRTKIDSILDRITMYRLVLYVLLAFIGIAALLAYFQVLPFSPLELLASTAFLLVMCWAMNTVFAFLLHIPTNVESASITALILALILTPAQSPMTFQLLGWAALLAMASKYLLALNKKHLFNPAAIAVVLTSFVLGESASWWVGTVSMLPLVLLGGLLVARKIRQIDGVVCFCTTVRVGIGVFSLLQSQSVLTALDQVFVQSPLFFFAFIMFTEPLTAPPTRNLRRLNALLVGILFLPQIHVGTLYSTPELALVTGNLFSYLVSPKLKVELTTQRKIKM